MKSSEGEVVLRVSSVLEDKLPPAATAARCLAEHRSAASLRAEASSLSESWEGGVVLLPILETTCTLSNGSGPSKTLSPSVVLEENKNQKTKIISVATIFNLFIGIPTSLRRNKTKHTLGKLVILSFGK